MCNYDYEVVVGNPMYRTALGSKLIPDYFNNPSKQLPLRQPAAQANVQT